MTETTHITMEEAKEAVDYLLSQEPVPDNVLAVDHAGAHAAEDKLYLRALQAIAAGAIDSPAELAALQRRSVALAGSDRIGNGS